MSDTVERVHRLEDHYHLKELADNSNATLELVNDIRNATSYSRTHQPAPFEFSPDFSGLEDGLISVEREVGSVREGVGEMVEQLDEIRFGVNLIGANTSTLPQMSMDVAGIHTLGKWGLGVAVVHGIIDVLQKVGLQITAAANLGVNSATAASTAATAQHTATILSVSRDSLATQRAIGMSTQRGAASLDRIEEHQLAALFQRALSAHLQRATNDRLDGLGDQMDVVVGELGQAVIGIEDMDGNIVRFADRNEQQLASVNLELGEANHSLATINTHTADAVDQLGEVNGHLFELNGTVLQVGGRLDRRLVRVGRNIGTRILRLGDQVEEGFGQTVLRLDRIDGTITAVGGQINDSLVQAIEHLDDMSWKMDGLRGDLKGLRRTVGKGFGRIDRSLRRGINRVVFAMQKSSEELAAVMHEGLGAIELRIAEAELARARDAQMQRHLLIEAELSAERRHEELMAVLRSPFQVRADEKYGHALRNFKIRHMAAAMKDLKAARAESSVHIPSLILSGRVGEFYAQWPAAKDFYDHAARLAIEVGNAEYFAEAAGRLLDVEWKLGKRADVFDVIDRYYDAWCEVQEDDGAGYPSNLIQLEFVLDRILAEELIDQINNYTFEYLLEGGDVLPLPRPDHVLLNKTNDSLRNSIQLLYSVAEETDFTDTLMLVYALIHQVRAFYRSYDLAEEDGQKYLRELLEKHHVGLVEIAAVLEALRLAPNFQEQKKLALTLRELVQAVSRDLASQYIEACSWGDVLNSSEVLVDVERTVDFKFPDGEVLKAECVPLEERLRERWFFPDHEDRPWEDEKWINPVNPQDSVGRVETGGDFEIDEDLDFSQEFDALVTSWEQDKETQWHNKERRRLEDRKFAAWEYDEFYEF